MTKPISGIGLTATTIGGVLIYAGIRGYSVLSVIQNMVTGKPITTGVAITNPLSTPGAGTAEVGTTDAGVPYAPGTPLEIGKRLAASMGWTGAEWSALEKLWDGESNWNPKAMNKSSGAYGIPQALPYSKMPKMAWPESAGGQSDATTQIQWGLSYIKSRYGSPSMAWAFWQKQKPHWY
jgi:resuscitation-promoting factor RpfB